MERNAVVKRADVGFDGHGILTMFVEFAGGDWGGGLPCFNLNGPQAAEYIKGVLEVFGVDTVSGLVGRPCVVHVEQGRVAGVSHFTDESRYFSAAVGKRVA